MNALHLTLGYFEPNSGVMKKINSQAKSLKNNGFEQVMIGIFDSDGYLTIDGKKIAQMPSISNIPAQYKFYRKLFEYIINNKVSFIYYRFNAVSEPSSIFFFYKLRKMGLKAVMEIPTYPYDGEKEKNRFYYLDKFTRRLLAKQFKRIITFSNDKVIFGQKTINISNGIDFDNIPLKHINQNEGEFNIIGVANYRYWHGFDRLIRGIAVYVKTNFTNQICFHIISGNENSDVLELRKLIADLDLQEYVKIYGEVSGKALDSLFDQCKIAIGSLGRHRNKIYSLKTLKNIEYAARGIPFIYSEENTDFDNQSYILKVPMDDSPIDIQSLIDFYHSVDKTPIKIRTTVLDYSWDNQMKTILSLLNNNEVTFSKLR